MEEDKNEELKDVKSDVWNVEFDELGDIVILDEVEWRKSADEELTRILAEYEDGDNKFCDGFTQSTKDYLLARRGQEALIVAMISSLQSQITKQTRIINQLTTKLILQTC